MEPIIKQCQRIEEDALYSSKSHYKAAGCWRCVHLWVNIPLVVLAAWAGLDVFENSAKLAGPLAMITALLAALNTVLNPEKRSTQHFTAGSGYDTLKKDVRLFYEIDALGMDQKVAKNQLKYLHKRCTTLNSVSPIIPRWAYKKAQKGIETGEATYEIDGGKT